MTHKHAYTLGTLFVLTNALVPAAFAMGETTVTNSMSSSANSGGNYAESGQVVEGESTNTTSVYTEVNGEVVEDYTEISSSSIEYHNSYSSGTDDNSTVNVHVETSANTGGNVATEAKEEPAEVSVESSQETHVTADDADEENAASTPDAQVAATTSVHATSSPSAQPNIINTMKLIVVNVLSYVFGWFS